MLEHQQEELVYVHNVSGAEYHTPPISLKPEDLDTTEIFDVDEIRVFKKSEIDNIIFYDAFNKHKLFVMTEKQANAYIEAKKLKENKRLEKIKIKLLIQAIYDAYEDKKIICDYIENKDYLIKNIYMLTFFSNVIPENEQKVKSIYDSLNLNDKKIVDEYFNESWNSYLNKTIKISRFSNRINCDIPDKHVILPFGIRKTQLHVPELLDELINKIEKVDEEIRPKTFLKKAYYKLFNRKPKMNISQKIKRNIEPSFSTINLELFKGIYENNRMEFEEDFDFIDDLKTAKKIVKKNYKQKLNSSNTDEEGD